MRHERPQKRISGTVRVMLGRPLAPMEMVRAPDIKVLA